MRDADLSGAKLPGTNVKYADLRGAELSGAVMQGADLHRTDLRDARMETTQLQGADLASTKLGRALLSRAKLQGADLASADLQGAILTRTSLLGARLAGAQLQGTRLDGIKLQGANLQGADLRGADLESADLQGANLAGTRLQGADLANAQLQGSFGKPAFWYLVWMPDVSLEFPPLGGLPNGGSQYERAMKYLENIESEDRNIELAWREGVSLGKHLREYLQKGITHEVFDGDAPGEKDLVYHDPEVTEWGLPAADVDSCDYMCAWAGWTAEFACESPHTATSSVDRWSSEEPLYKAKSRLKDKLSCLKERVREALIERKKDGRCLGLAAVSNEDRMRFFAERREPRKSRMCAEHPARTLSPHVAGCTNVSTTSPWGRRLRSSLK